MVTLVSIKEFIYVPLMLPAFAAYLSLSPDIKEKVAKDVRMYWARTRGSVANRSTFGMWYRLMTSNRVFRNVFYCRVGAIGSLLNIFLKEEPTLNIERSLCHNYGGGLYIAHGTSCQVYANKIGENLWMHQNVTLGMIGEGRPEIGDNVYIGTGAVVLGGIKIGNNVRIGANAIVVDNIPDNSVVVSPKGKVIKTILPARETQEYPVNRGG